MNRILTLFVAIAVLMASPLIAAYDRYQNQGSRDLRASLDEIRHELSNHETMIQIFEQKFATQENIVESFGQQIEADQKSNKDLIQGKAANVDQRVLKLEALLQGMVEDMRQLRSQSSELEKQLNEQNNNTDHLKNAVGSLMDALQANVPELEGKMYQVKSEDTLGDIALRHHTSVKAIKEINQMKNDRILIGQKLKLP